MAMGLEDAVAASLTAYPVVFAVLLAGGFFVEEAYLELPGFPIPPDTPRLFKVCAEPPLVEDVRWAASEWNRAFEGLSLTLRVEVVADGCFVRVKATDSPLMGEFGGRLEITPKEGLDTSKVEPDDIRFWMFESFTVTIWNTEDGKLRRAIILHELGHAMLLNHIRDYRGPEPTPVMLDSLDPRNPPTGVTKLDAYLAWLRHEFCRTRACGITYVVVTNMLATSLVSTAASTAVAAVLVLFGRVTGRD